LDIGAHEGIFIFSVFNTVGTYVVLHWFEPDRDLFSRLRDNLRRNFIVTYGNQAAAADQDGWATFFRNLTDDLSGSLGTHFRHKHTTQPENVETIGLSDYLVRHQIAKAIVKVDVEGTGSQVWAGLADRCDAVSYLVIEMLAPEIKEGLPARIINDSGWHAYYIRDFELVQSLNGDFEYVAPYWNWLFCALSPAGLRKRLSRTKFRVIAAA
jgi:FkbM family methyltransferase